MEWFKFSNEKRKEYFGFQEKNKGMGNKMYMFFVHNIVSSGECGVSWDNASADSDEVPFYRYNCVNAHVRRQRGVTMPQ